MKKQPLPLLPATKEILMLVCVLLLLSPAPGSAIRGENVSVTYFYEEGCFKCQQASPVVEKVIEKHPDIDFSSHEIMTEYSLVEEYGILTVPAFAINRKIITYDDYGGNENLLEALLSEAIENPSSSSDSELLVPEPRGSIEKNKPLEPMNPFFILAAGILAGFNPCLLAVMAFLASVTISQQGRRKEMLKITFGFSAGIFTMYMFAGLSVLGTINFLPEIRRTFSTLTVLLTALLGMWHIYDAYWLKTHAKSTFKTPESLKNFMGRMGQKNLLLLSFLSGSMFSLVKAPCVGAIYLSILNLLVTKNDVMEGIFYMGIYNIGLLLPIITLGLLLSFGLSPKKVTEFREKRRVEIRLTTGLILIVLALLLHLGIL